MRAMASLNRLAGFRKICGYEKYVKAMPGLLMT